MDNPARGRKVFLKYTDEMMPDPTCMRGVCECGHCPIEGEPIMGYPNKHGDHDIVCLTCHFWYVHEENRKKTQ